MPVRGGVAIPLQNILQAMTVADVANQKLWCSPATQIGPRVFITAAHCVPALDQVKELRVRNSEAEEFVSYSIVPAIPPITDDSSVETPACKALIGTKSDRATLTRDEMKSCWAADGAMDIALLISDRTVNGKMVSLAKSSSQVGERLNLLGWNDSSEVVNTDYRSTPFQIFGYVGSQVVMDGSADGSWGWPGESGGVYFNATMEATAINTGGTNPDHLIVHLYGKEIHLPANFAGGADLTISSTQAWLKSVTANQNLEICGLNLFCPPTQKPLQ